MLAIASFFILYQSLNLHTITAYAHNATKIRNTNKALI
nr:MAG TPA: hypothetical protein [Bacteriophage sp.]